MTPEGRLLAVERQVRRLDARVAQLVDDVKDLVDDLACFMRRVEILEAAAARAGLDLDEDELTDDFELGEPGA